MSLLKNLIVCFLIILTLDLCLSNAVIAQKLYAEGNVPEHDPQSWSTPEVEVPVVKVKKKGSWFWWIIGLTVIAGAAAAAAPSPEKGSSSNGSSGGVIGITW